MKKRILLPGLMFLMAAIVVAQTTTTVVDGVWSNPLVWDNGVPDQNTNANVLHNLTLDANGSVLTLTVGTPTGVLTNSSRNLEIYGDFNVTTSADYLESGNGKTKKRGAGTFNGDIYFEELQLLASSNTVAVNDTVFIKNFLKLASGTLDVSGGGLVFLDNALGHGNLGYSKGGSLVGDYVWQLNIDRCNEWSSYSAPVNTTLEGLASNAIGQKIYTGFTGSDHPTFNFVNTYFYDEVSGYTVPTSKSNALNRGQGYWYWNSDEVYLSEETSIPQQWTVELVGTTSLSGTFDYGVTFGNTNFNLIGNPYPGVLDWNSKYWTKTNVNDAVYYWNTCTQSYSSYVGGVGSNGGERYIVAGQGFFVETNAASPELTSTQKILSNVDNRVVKSIDEEIPDFITITLNNDQTVLTFDEGATNGFDGFFDAKKLIAPVFVNDLSSIKTVYNGVNYSVNTLPFESTVVPLDVKGEGEITFTGANLFADIEIYLEDKLTGDVVDMKLMQSYNFSNEEKDFTDRFNIIINKKSPLSKSETIESSSSEFSVYPNPVNDKLNILSKKNFDRVEVYTTLGKLVMSKFVTSNRSVLDMNTLNSGVYFVKIFNGTKEIGVVMTQKM